MADDTTQASEPETAPVRTAADLALDKVNERLDALEAGYKARIDELQRANAELWAALHPAPPVQQAAVATADPAPSEDEGMKAIRDRLGI